jgi:hypothetical protein
LFPLFATGVKFTLGVIDTGGKLPPVLRTPMVEKLSQSQQHQQYLWKNLPSVSLILIVHLDLRISPQIFEKFLNDPKVIFTVLVRQCAMCFFPLDSNFLLSKA